ncbi:MAG: phosphoribosylamine--glycine ligase [Clostridia bacterium]|nr:phosphoribosylamine--glycine ligase [Clostridia bacterium]
MKIMVIGSGGREHAVVKAIKKNPKADEVYVLPGNGGIAADAECVNVAATDLDAVVAFACEKQIDYAVVTPDDPLVLGLVDRLETIGVPCFGPRKNAAIIEGSKVFSKDLMKRYRIPTARYEVFTDPAAALAYLDTVPAPIVVKADGLALGKGVTVAETTDEAKAAVLSLMRDKKFGKSGERIVIEEYLTGPEVSVLAFTDSHTLVPMVSSMDHKRALDGDRGENTGGMGTVAPNPYYTEEIAARCMREIFLPTMNAMNAEGRPFKGCLYFGLMLTPDGPKVIEYNCRFGDPETQVVLPLLESDLLEIMLAVTEERLAEADVRFSDRAACCLIAASAGYPGKYEKGKLLTIPESLLDRVYVAGAKKEGESLFTNGGRVLGVTEVRDTLSEAVAAVYEDMRHISFENKYCRSDIGRRALSASEDAHG